MTEKLNLKEISMLMNNVESSNIAQIGYDTTTFSLFVSLKGTNVIYQYLAVPKHVYVELVQAKSKGKYHATNIKNKFKFEKILVE